MSDTRGLLRRLATVVGPHRRIVLLSTAVLAVVAAALGGNVSSKLDQGATGSAFEVPGSRAVVAEAMIARATGSETDPGVLVLVRPRGPVTGPAGSRLVTEAMGILRRDPAIGRVVDPLGAARGELVSTDGRAALVVAYTKRLSSDASYAAGVRIEREIGHRAGLTLGGSLVANVELSQEIQRDLQLAEAIGLPIVFLLALWVFGGVLAALLPVGVGIVTILVTMLVLRVILFVSPISVYAINMVTGLGLGLSIDYTLLVVSRFREETEAGRSSEQAVVWAVARAGRTVVFSSCTVCIAMASLLCFPLPFMVSMGIGGLVAPLCAAAVAVVALPAAVSVLGARLVPRPGVRRRLAGTVGRSRHWERIGGAAVRRALPMLALGVAVLVALGLPAIHMRFIGTTADDLPGGVSARMVAQVVGRKLPQAVPPSFELAIPASHRDMAAVAALGARVARDPEVAATIGPVAIGPHLWELAVTARSGPYTPAAEKLLRRIEQARAPFSMLATGPTAEQVSQQDHIGARLPWALGLLALGTIAVIVLMTRSLVLAGMTVLTNTLTIGATLGILVLVFQDGHGAALLGTTRQGGLVTTQPFLVCALAFALATDYGVFLLSRVKEARDGGAATLDAIVAGVARTGTIITSAALLFCVAVGSFSMSPIALIKEIGLGAALAVVLDASVVRALLVPALMALIGDAAWWPARPGLTGPSARDVPGPNGCQPRQHTSGVFG